MKRFIPGFFLLLTGCLVWAQTFSLDGAIAAAAAEIEAVLPAGARIAVLNIASGSEAFSNYAVEELTASLVRRKNIVVLNRNNLEYIRAEMNYRLSRELSGESAQAIGKMLGAEYIIFGSLTDMGRDYRFRVQAVNVSSAIVAVLQAVTVDDPLTGFLLTGAGFPEKDSGERWIGPWTVFVYDKLGYLTYVSSVTSTPDGRIISGGWEDQVKIYSREGVLLHALSGHRRDINAVASSPDGRRIISGSNDNTVKIWDAETGRLLRTLRCWRNVLAVAYSPDGKQICAGLSSNRIKVWDAETGRLLRTLKHGRNVTALAYSPDSRRIASCSSNNIRVWDAESGALLCSFANFWNNAISAGGFSVAFSPDGRRIISDAFFHIVGIWDTETGELLNTLEGHTSWVTAVAYSPDGRRIISGSEDNTIRIWDAESGRLLQILVGGSDSVNAAVFSLDGKRILSASWRIDIWDRDDGIRSGE
jgi:WD40 repeat protein/TolB-like protein